MRPAARVLITGCSGGGKSTLVADLAARGFATVPEPGRRIVREALATGAPVLPWEHPAAFARAALAMASADLAGCVCAGPAFFDRGTVDAALALEHAAGVAAERSLAGLPRYAETVILVPPWPALFAADAERRHGLDAAIAEYERIAEALPRLGYRAAILPQGPVAERVDGVLAALAPGFRPR